jgi:hypothetical protein
MLVTIEQIMTFLRRVKLYVTFGGAVASALALANVETTRALMFGLARAGNDFTHRIFENELTGIMVIGGVGLGILTWLFRHNGEPKLPEIPVYFVVGLLAVFAFFWLLPQLAHLVAVELLSPVFRALADFLTGDATISLKLLLKLLFLVYLISFVVDMLFQRYVRGKEVSEAVSAMSRKYWKELLKVGHDIFDVAMVVPRLLIRSRHGPDNEL